MPNGWSVGGRRQWFERTNEKIAIFLFDKGQGCCVRVMQLMATTSSMVMEMNITDTLEYVFSTEHYGNIYLYFHRPAYRSPPLPSASSASIQFEINPIQSNYLIPFIRCANSEWAEWTPLASIPFPLISCCYTSPILAVVVLWEMFETIENTTVKFIKWNDSKIIFLLVVGRCWFVRWLPIAQ